MSSSFGLTADLVSYLARMNPAETAAMIRCRVETAGMGRDARMQISSEQGAFMDMVARLINARLAVEVGVFTGYSAMATAYALRRNAGPGARLYACDVSAAFMEKAKGYWADAGLLDVIAPRVGPGADSLDALAAEGLKGRIDLMFVDANKTGYDDYFEKGLTLLRPGGLILFDNMLWGGDVADEANMEADTVALRALAEKLRDDPRVDACLVGIGDGVMMARKR
jgi:O-methyltransferase